MAARQAPGAPAAATAAPPPGSATAPPAPGAHPVYTLPKYTPEECYVQHRQGELIQKDVRSLNAMKAEAPFANLQDAVMRLLPFHLFNAADPALADLDDTPDHMGADLMASRHQAWEELCMSKANDLRKRAEAHSSSIAELEASMNREALTGTRSIDLYAMVKVQQEDLKQKIATDKAALAKLMPAAPAVSAVSSTAGKPGGTAATAAGPGLVGQQMGAVNMQALQAAAAAAAAGKGPAVAGRVPQAMLPGGLQLNALGLNPTTQQQLLLLQQQPHLFTQLPPQQQQQLQQQLLAQQRQQQELLRNFQAAQIQQLLAAQHKKA